MTLSVRLAEVELPSQEYEADLLWPMQRHGAVSFVLDRLSLRDESRVETRVEVRLSYESFLAFWTTTQGEQFTSKLRAWLAANPLDEDLDTQQGGDDPEQGRAVIRAHLARLAFVGSDAEISFYAIPASYMSEAITDPGVATVPIAGVLRVTTSTYAVARLLSACAPLAEKIGPMMVGGEAESE